MQTTFLFPLASLTGLGRLSERNEAIAQKKFYPDGAVSKSSPTEEDKAQIQQISLRQVQACEEVLEKAKRY